VVIWVLHYWAEHNIGIEFDDILIIFLILRIFTNSFFIAMKIINYSSFKWKEIVIITFIFLYSNRVLSQNLDSIVIWTENYKISWNDYLGKKFIIKENVAANSSSVLKFIPGYHENSYVATNSSFVLHFIPRYHENSYVAANSSFVLHFIPGYHENSDNSYTIINVFYKYKSSVINRNYKLLEHEQIHFDIQEIFSRKIRKQFEVFKNCKVSEYTHREIFNNYLDSLSNYQEKYDLDTNYSLIKKKQEFWKAIVAKKLKELDLYSVGNLYHIKKEN